MPRKFVFFFSLFLVFVSVNAKAAVFDPKSGWQTIQTDHFRLHHPKNITEQAKHAAGILENIYPDITAKWRWKPWNRTEVIFTDSTDTSNGMSSVLPYNWMLIYLAPPPPDSSLGHYDDWLRTLLVHEYTHIVQLDACGGVWRAVKVFLGKTVAPSGVNPTWLKEGISQLDETVMTSGGRGRGSFSEMVVRTSILEKAFPSIDLADGLSWKWPGFKGAYVYGIKFVQWLIDTYGEDKFMELDRRTRSSLMLTMINHQARAVYGKTFYELWNEWRRGLEARYAKEMGILEAEGLTKQAVIVPQEHYEQYESPTISHDGTKLAFTATSPYKKTELRLLDIGTGKIEVLKKGQSPEQISWTSDGTKLVYNAIGQVKRYYSYYDLWLYDFTKEGKKRTTRLTNGKRAKDPDFDPSGAFIVFVSHDGGMDILKRMDLETKKITGLSDELRKFTRFSGPRISLDGKYIAVSAWTPRDGWRIYRTNIDGTSPTRLTEGTGLVIEMRPVWAPDSKSVLFSSDESGISNIYEAPVTGRGSKKVINVATGVFQPTVSPDGGIFAQRYNSKGFEIAKFEKSTTPKGKPSKESGKQRVKDQIKEPLSEIQISPTAETSVQGQNKDLESKKYVAFGKSLFLPRFILPNAAYTGDTFFASIMTGGADPLRWHNWSASATYRTDANFFGYSFQYWYNRFKPLFGTMVLDYAVNFGDITFVTTDGTGAVTSSRTVRFFERRRGVATFVSVPIQRHGFTAAYYFEDHTPKTSLTPDEAAALNEGYFAGFRFEYHYGDAERYPALISPEHGRTIRLTTSVTDKALGSGDKNEQVIFSGDWREYIKLYGRHVMALRLDGGMTWGDRLVQGTFGLGGALGEGSFGGASSYNYFPLRGLPVSALSRTRALLMSGEYRFPILDVLRGAGTVPFFLKDISGALFADYGNAWNAHENGSDSFYHFFDEFMLGVGAELRGDFIVGHGLPIHGRVGYAIIVVNRDRLGGLTDPILGDSIKNGMLVLTLGTSF